MSWEDNSPTRELIRNREEISNNTTIAEGAYTQHDAQPLLTPISTALSLSLEKKSVKIANFLEKYTNSSELEAHLHHLHGFATSSGGLIKDEFRERIWPILARNIPQTKRYSSIPTRSVCSSDELNNDSHIQRPEELNLAESNDHLKEQQLSDVSDSDFESALSNLSTSGDDYPTVGDDDDATTAHTSPSPDIPLEELQAHAEWKQVELDVARTLSRFPPGIDDLKRETLQEQLARLIVRILCENKQFHYYQGFHDVCLTILLVLDFADALKVVRQLCQRGAFVNYLSCSLESSVLVELEDLYVLLFLHDQELERRMRDTELGTLFALSWPLTWFSHALQHHTQVLLFFDFFLCSHPLMPIYVSAALVCERRDEVLECEPEMPYLHKLLNHIPTEMNFHRILDTARALFASYPPLVLSELKEEYLLIRDRQRRQRSALEMLDMLQNKHLREQLRTAHRSSSSQSLRLNVYEMAKPFALCGGMAALAVVYYYVHKSSMLL